MNPSTTRGCSTPSGCPTLFSTPGPTPLPDDLSNEVFVKSDAADATASVLIGMAPGGANLLDAVTSGATVTARCNNDTLGTVSPEFSASSRVDALVIAGNVIPIPGALGKNTFILASQFPLLTLNEQKLEDCNISSNSAKCTVTALHAQILPPQIPLGLIDLKLSSAVAKITFDSSCVCNGAMLMSSKEPHVLAANGIDDKVPQVPNPNDTIKYIFKVSNGGCVKSGTISILDRLPKGVTLVDTPEHPLPPGAALAPCSVAINHCGAASSDQCLSIPVGTVDVNQTVQTQFFVTVDPNAGCNANGVGSPICNAYRLQGEGAPTDEPGPALAVCPHGQPTPVGTTTPAATATPGGGGNGTPTPVGTTTPNPIGTSTPGIGGGFLATTGSGGCSIGGSSEGPFEVLPVLVLGAWLIVRGSRRSRRPF